jgi:formate--tetrahydrofolate ligase
MKKIKEIASLLHISEDDLILYGNYKAKVPLKYIDPDKYKINNLILVSAISPTPAGEGKTTITIGLTQGMNRIGKQTTAVLREPSLGPVFGIK